MDACQNERAPRKVKESEKTTGLAPVVLDTPSAEYRRVIIGVLRYLATLFSDASSAGLDAVDEGVEKVVWGIVVSEVLGEIGLCFAAQAHEQWAP